MHIEHRTWFPFILVGLTLALFLGVFAWLQSPSGGDVKALQLFSPTVEEYERDVSEIISVYALGSESNFNSGITADTAYESLLDTRVPAEYKNLHLQLVLVFTQAVADPEFDIYSELVKLREVYTWLPYVM